MLAICLLALVETASTAEADDSLPENGKIAFTRAPGHSYYIYTVNPDGYSLSRLTNGNPLFPDFPAWSPDGTQIAFHNAGQIGVMGADGSNLRILTPNKLDVRYRPRWSPDGKRLAFGVSVSDYDSDIYTVDLDGSNITNITNSPEVSEDYVDFSPDGSQLCLNRFPKSDQKQGIYVMNVDGSNPTQLTGDSGWRCAWSPDGTKIAYSESPGSGYEVYVMNADGSGKTNLTNNRAEDEYPQWSPDGTKIAFASDRDGDYEIYTMDVDGSDVSQVTNTLGIVADLFPDWQPQTAKSRSLTVHPPHTGGPPLFLVASALLFSGGVMFYAGLKRRV